MAKKTLPFSLLPYTWGMTGKARERAQAEHELSGYELKKRLLEIDSDMHTTEEYIKKTADLDFEYQKTTKTQYLRVLANLMKDPKQKALALVELDFKENLISENEYQKQVATLKDEPWVAVLSMDFVGAKGLEGSFELDWNEAFVENLKKEGYVGPTPDSLVNQWFISVCKNVALEEFDGTGDFTADANANFETMKRWNSEAVDSTRKGYK